MFELLYISKQEHINMQSIDIKILFHYL